MFSSSSGVIPLTHSLYAVAFSTLLLTTGLIGGLLINPSTSSKGQELLSWLYDRWLGLLTAAFVNSVLQAVAVYWQSFHSGELLAKGGNSGNFVYDVSSFFMNECSHGD